jgi:hypothetical protein
MMSRSPQLNRRVYLWDSIERFRRSTEIQLLHTRPSDSRAYCYAQTDSTKRRVAAMPGSATPSTPRPRDAVRPSAGTPAASGWQLEPKTEFVGRRLHPNAGPARLDPGSHGVGGRGQGQQRARAVSRLVESLDVRIPAIACVPVAVSDQRCHRRGRSGSDRP